MSLDLFLEQIVSEYANFIVCRHLDLEKLKMFLDSTNTAPHLFVQTPYQTDQYVKEDRVFYFNQYEELIRLLDQHADTREKQIKQQKITVDKRHSKDKQPKKFI